MKLHLIVITFQEHLPDELSVRSEQCVFAARETVPEARVGGVDARAGRAPRGGRLRRAPGARHGRRREARRGQARRRSHRTLPTLAHFFPLAAGTLLRIAANIRTH